MKHTVLVITGAVISGALLIVTAASGKDKLWTSPAEAGAYISQPTPVRLEAPPPSAAIIYHDNGYIYVMDEDGRNERQISFEKPQGSWEHVAISHDRRFIAANEQLPNPKNRPGGVSRVWLYDLVKKTRSQLVPHFETAGNGGIDWDRNGFIYFAAKEKDSIPNPKSPEDFRANAGENDIYRMRHSGTPPERLTRTKDHGEADVSVSLDSTMIAYAGLNIPEEAMEIWVAKADGTDPRLVFKGGIPRTAGVHDPELSPDNSFIVFSRVNPDVPPNFPDNPAANTSHDIYQARLDGSGLVRLTLPGHISITPDWRDDNVLFLDISEQEKYAGISVVKPFISDQKPRLIKNGANIAKWAPGAE